MPPDVANDTTSPSLESEKQRLLDLMRQGESVHWQMGVHYNNIVDNKLAEAAGFKSAREFFAQQIKELSQATLCEYGTVAKAFSEAEALEHGCTKLSLLLTYETLVHAGPVAGAPDDVQLNVPNKTGGSEVKKFRDCSVADLSAAIKAMKAPIHPLPEPDAQAVARMGAALESALGPASSAQLDARTRGRVTVVDLRGVPLAKLATVLDALKSAL